MEEKYVVFKTEDFDQLLIDIANGGLPPHVGDALNKLETSRLEDAVVIRRQDIFSAPAFFEYAGQIRTTIETIREVVVQDVDEDKLTALAEIADYFQEQGLLAAATDKKIPD